MSESLLRATLRAVGRLQVRGVIDRALAASIIRRSWVESSAELMPEGSTHGSYEAQRWALAVGAHEHWCATCPGIPHRVSMPGQKCPSCADDERRAG